MSLYGIGTWYLLLLAPVVRILAHASGSASLAFLFTGIFFPASLASAFLLIASTELLRHLFIWRALRMHSLVFALLGDLISRLVLVRVLPFGVSLIIRSRGYYSLGWVESSEDDIGELSLHEVQVNVWKHRVRLRFNNANVVHATGGYPNHFLVHQRLD